MPAYRHNDMNDLERALQVNGYRLTHDGAFNNIWAKGDDLIIVDLPKTEVYEWVEVSTDETFPVPNALGLF